MSEDGFDKTGIAMTVVVLFVIATVGILVVGEMGDVSQSELEKAQNQTADPYDGDDYQPYWGNWAVLLTAIGLSPNGRVS